MLSRAVSFIFVLFLCAGVSFASDGALVGHWKLDETSGTVAGDSSGHGNNGTLIEAVPGSLIWEQGRTSGGALRFDGDGPANNTNPACRVSIPTAGMSAARGTVALCVKLDQPPFNVNNRQDLVYFFGLKGPSTS